LKIKKLPEEVINKIAAGEIVERPANVLKELIENSLDAGATLIEVYIEKGGKRLISVKDNGEGISGEDIVNAVSRFATSKIRSEEDLFYITTYGFRGEALASISSVSKFRILSRTIDEPIGHELIIEGGKIKSLTEKGSSIGTLVEVRDIFYNVPARAKFLKSERTELVHILDVFTKYVLRHPQKHFKIYIDGKELYNLYPTTLEERLKSIFPQKIINNLTKINYENALGKVEGFISLGNETKKSYLYINGRPVKSALIQKQIKKLIGNSFYLLFIELPPYFVDHNVHPAKLEVKFRKEAPVVNLVKGALEENLNPFKTHTVSFQDTLKQETSVYNLDKKGKFEIIGQVEDTFLIVYYNGELYIIDQHVAHERILYELLLNQYMEKGYIPSQKLIVPVPLKLTPDQLAKLVSFKDRLEKIGYKFDIKEPMVFVQAVPADISISAAEEALKDILETGELYLPVEEIFSMIACKQSITAGDRLNKEKAASLLEMWIKTNNPNLCPHGRPIYYKISLDEIKKAVGRK